MRSIEAQLSPDSRAYGIASSVFTGLFQEDGLRVPIPNLNGGTLNEPEFYDNRQFY